MNEHKYDFDYCISIHALRGEGDPNTMYLLAELKISIHALRGEGDSDFEFDFGIEDISIHALRGEGDKCRASAVRGL